MSVSFVFCIFSPPCLNLILFSNELLIILYNQRLFCPFWNNDGRTSDDRLFFSLFVFEVIVIVIVNVTVIVIVTVDYLKLNNYCLILLSNLKFGAALFEQLNWRCNINLANETGDHTYREPTE
ncbi:hypothetical protein PPL_10737 [Heterostelium album PN500]|uniref:Uncharacterized protein n=1 Tax=Heterostelium pallidum (strain ATCC 26659 / Pp 5 / PN500) TaxID=670386 RepID=D3BSB1_HETP5|nr:hypothetical protein PPL_10737 [Heterostelium album PN500]EFA75684.1 hypothetical protein PPL_10737 [Heterostelium album PN500]|eukprot:XP_020427818.1 hypothetical protein PPL_10737 [Heterostelium album PN500]